MDTVLFDRPITRRADCEALDATDPLAAFRDRFALPEGVIYLDGNSLGALPATAPGVLTRTVAEEWGVDLIRSWNTADWYTLPTRLGDRIGSLIGAAPGQTVVCDTTSINLYKAVKAAMTLRPERRVIVSESTSFPTDLYILEGATADSAGTWQRRLLGRDAPSLDALLDETVGVVLLSNVDYRTGALRDMAAVTRQAHAVGALVVWDLCHSAGVVPMALDTWQVDFAVGCTYKYLNGGPGSPAYIYVARRHHERAFQPLSGWWGHAAPFAFESDYRPEPGIRRFLCGTPPILSMKGVECGLDTFDGVDMHVLHRKSQRLTGLFMERLATLLGDAVEIVTPNEPERRGSQVALRFAHGYPVVQAMIARGVIGDFRAPDIMRFGFAPLYLRYVDVWDAAQVMADCFTEQVWTDPRFQERAAVT